MRLGETASVFSAFGVWRATGSQRAGAVLARALASPDETNRTAAGILLARAGARALPLLRDNLTRGVGIPMTLRLLGEIGSDEAAALVEPYRDDPDPQIAAAARAFVRR